VSVRRALAIYRAFQARAPDFVTALDKRIQFPARIGSVGRVKRLLYRSAKWTDGEEEHAYIHDYESPVEFCEPWREGLRAVKSPRWPRELVQLGSAVELELATHAGERAFVSPVRGTLLCATPNGRTLVLLHPGSGIVAALVGGEQRVTDRGVEG